MEQSVLALAVTRRVTAFAGVVALTLLGARVGTVEPREPLVVEVAPDLSPFAVAQRVHDAVALAEARARGWVRTDPVIVRRLVANLRFLGESGTDQALLDAAISLGMDLTDPVVRARLLDRMARELEAPPAPPTDDVLAMHLRDHASAFRRPEVLHVTWRVLADDVDAAAALATLREGGDVPSTPVLDLRDDEPTTATRLRGRLGDAVADAVSAAPEGVWVGPMTTSLGTRIMARVTSRRPGVLPPLDEIRPAVEASWRAAGAPAWRNARRAALHEAWRPTVVVR